MVYCWLSPVILPMHGLIFFKTEKKMSLEEAKKLDAVGQEDGDVDNDGDVDKSDKYLLKRRKAISNTAKEDEPKKTGKDKEIAVMNPKKEEKKTATTEGVLSFRQKLMSVFEAKKQPADSGTEAEKMDSKDSPGAKKMRDDNKDTGEYHDLEDKGHDDATKAGRITKKAPARSNDQDTGDKKIVNPQAKVKEAASFSSMLSSVNNAYNSMYQKKDQKDGD